MARRHRLISGSFSEADARIRTADYSQVTIIGRFTDNLGVYVFHCHNVIDEDAGMMAQFEVVKRRSTS